MADRPAGNVHATRSVVHAPNGMLATSQPLASAAGLQILLKGGNAFDAAVAAAAVLSVVEPMMTGLGGDMFALCYSPKKGKVEAINGSGRAPALATCDFFRERGMAEIPNRGIYSVSVPGTVDGWAQLLERYGTLSFKEVLQPAIDYAENGFSVAEIVAAQWKRNAALLRRDEMAASTYLINNRAPKHGEKFANPRIAATLKQIAEKGRDAFYKGAIAGEMIRYVKELGGLLREEDLAQHTSTWIEPASTSYKGYTILELPPNGQGITTLEMLNILEEVDLVSMGHNSADYLHHLIEAKRLAYADRDHYICDPDFADCPVEQLLSKAYAASRRALINPEKAAAETLPGLDFVSDTVYLTVVDKDRNVVSFINSIFKAFGSGISAGETGVLLQNRGALFSLEENHRNCLKPGKRPFHTIIPAMVLKDGTPYFSFGVMGGDMQPQGQVQVLMNLLEFNMNVQEAGEAPRFFHSNRGVALESGINDTTAMQLIDKGHQIVKDVDVFGGYQGILINPETGMLQGGSDPRKDGCAIGY